MPLKDDVSVATSHPAVKLDGAPRGNLLLPFRRTSGCPDQRNKGITPQARSRWASPVPLRKPCGGLTVDLTCTQRHRGRDLLGGDSPAKSFREFPDTCDMSVPLPFVRYVAESCDMPAPLLFVRSGTESCDMPAPPGVSVMSRTSCPLRYGHGAVAVGSNHTIHPASDASSAARSMQQWRRGCW